METTVKIRIPDEVIEMFTINALLQARGDALEDIQSLGPDYGRLLEYRREDFRNAMENFHAADRMLRYYTTQDHYNALVA